MGSGSANASEGGLGRQLFWSMAGGLAFVSVANATIRGEFQKFSWGGVMLGAFLAFAITSTLWSYTPGATVKRAALLIIVTLISVAAFGKAGDRAGDFGKIFFAPLLALAVGSVLVSALFPGYAFTDLGWRGVTSHKNEMGQVMAVSIIITLLGNVHPRFRGATKAVALAALLGGLVLSKSSTSMLALVAGVTLIMVIILPRWLENRPRLTVAFLGTVLVTLIALYVGFLFDALPGPEDAYYWLLSKLGKSENFTGRTAIWQLVLNESRYHNTLIGGGYGGFWVGRDSVSGYVIIGNNLYPGQAHNGYLDVFNELGIFGLVLLALVLLTAIRRLWALHAVAHPEARMHIAIIVMMLFLNFGESTFFRNTQFTTLVFIASLVRVSALMKENKTRGMEAAARYSRV